MKIGIISDIHGNIEALNHVLEEFEKRKVEKIICCGDIIGIGPCSEEAVQKLIRYKDILIGVRGNHEQYYFVGIPKKVHDEKRPIREEEINCHKWTQSNLSKESIAFLEKFPIEQEIEVEDKKIYITHYPQNEDGSYKKHIKKATTKEIEGLFKEKDADVYLYGHTHIENFNEVDGKLYINPGTLGCPGTSNTAKCGILTIEKEINYEQLEVEYNSEKVIEKIKEIKYPLYKKMLMLFYGVTEELVQALGEFVNVQNIEKSSMDDVYLGNVYFNSEKIGAYVLGKSIESKFHGKVVGILRFRDTNEERLIVADKSSNLDYADIKSYFSEELRAQKFKCLNEKCAGAVIYKMVDGNTRFLIIYSKKNIAGFPKGHIEAGETEIQAAKREILEEVGLEVDFKNDFREEISYYVDDTPILKKAVFFLAQIEQKSKINIQENEISKYEFMSIEEAKEILIQNTKEILIKANNYIEKGDKI